MIKGLIRCSIASLFVILCAGSSAFIPAQTDTSSRWDSTRIAAMNALVQSSGGASGTTMDTGSQGRLARAIKAPQENLAGIVLRVIGWLALLILIVFGGALAMKKLGLVGSSKIGGGASMDMLEILPLGQNRSIMLVRVLDRVFLLGQTPTTIERLETFEGEKAVDLIAASKGGPTIVQFKDAFNNFISRIKK